MDEDLIKYPLHPNQHGFLKGKSTETAISKTINSIEKFVSNDLYSIAVFPDIQGAFDTISPEHARNALLKHGGHNDMVNWYYNYLTHRNLSSEIGGHKGEITIDIGFPQGGVCLSLIHI